MEKIKNNYKSIVLVLGFVAILFSIVGLIEVMATKDLYNFRQYKNELNIVIFGGLFSLGSAIALFVLSLLNKHKKLYVAIAGLFVFVSLIFMISFSVAIDKFTFTSFLEFALIASAVIVYVLALKYDILKKFALALLLYHFVYYLKIACSDSFLCFLSIAYLFIFVILTLNLYANEIQENKVNKEIVQKENIEHKE